jgi:hypothetical protein
MTPASDRDQDRTRRPSHSQVRSLSGVSRCIARAKIVKEKSNADGDGGANPGSPGAVGNRAGGSTTNTPADTEGGGEGESNRTRARTAKTMSKAES